MIWQLLIGLCRGFLPCRKHVRAHQYSNWDTRTFLLQWNEFFAPVSCIVLILVLIADTGTCKKASALRNGLLEGWSDFVENRFWSKSAYIELAELVKVACRTLHVFGFGCQCKPWLHSIPFLRIVSMQIHWCNRCKATFTNVLHSVSLLSVSLLHNVVTFCDYCVNTLLPTKRICLSFTNRVVSVSMLIEDL